MAEVPSSIQRSSGIRPPVSRKTPLLVSDAMRRHGVVDPPQCRDLSSKLANLNSLIAGTEREYQTMLSELDRLDNEGRGWLVVDLIHKTAMASIDLAAAMLQVTGQASGDAARVLADGTQTLSDAIGTSAGLADGSVSGAQAARTVAQRAITHYSPASAGAAYLKGTADVGLSGWANGENIVGAKGTPSAGTRTLEAGVDGTAALVQRTADTLGAGDPKAPPMTKRVAAVAQIARAMATYNREVEGAFNRRLDISGGLQATRASYKTSMEQLMARYRWQAAEIRRLLAAAGCR